MLIIHMSNEENLGLGYIGDYTTQFCGDYNKLVHGTLLNNQYNGLSKVFLFFSWLTCIHMYQHFMVHLSTRIPSPPWEDSDMNADSHVGLLGAMREQEMDKNITR